MLDTITVRRMPFEFTEEIDPVIFPSDHALSFQLVAGSLLLPHLEPYLIRSMKAAREHVHDPAILDGLDRFCAQEGHHYRMHMKFNAAIRRAGFPELEAFEKKLSNDYRRFSQTKSLRFNLAYAEGFEALTMNSIKLLMEPDGFGDDLPDFMQMIEWHFVEELEHRTVAFDVYDHVVGSYPYRLVAGAWAQWHFTSWMRKVAAYMLRTCPQPKESVDRATEHPVYARVSRGATTVGEFLPSVLRIYMPSYSPHDVEIAPGMERLARKYSEMALATS